jgi:4-carboxymuconolactone decarboxylase
MSNDVSDERWERGAAKMQEVYGSVVPVVPKGLMDFADIMVADCFGDVWTREGLDVGQRRLLVMGVIASLGEAETWAIQCKAAIEKGELTGDQLREVLIQLTPYIGYPRAAGLVGPTEAAIAGHPST